MGHEPPVRLFYAYAVSALNHLLMLRLSVLWKNFSFLTSKHLTLEPLVPRIFQAKSVVWERNLWPAIIFRRNTHQALFSWQNGSELPEDAGQCFPCLIPSEESEYTVTHITSERSGRSSAGSTRRQRIKTRCPYEASANSPQGMGVSV